MTDRSSSSAVAEDESDEPPVEEEASVVLEVRDVRGVVVPVRLREDWSAGLLGGGLWSTGSAMSGYFAAHASSVRDGLRRCVRPDASSRRARALELGSGHGLLSVCLAVAVRGDALRELVVTDAADHLPLIGRTLFDDNAAALGLRRRRRADDEHDDADAFDGAVRLRVVEHAWGTDEKDDDDALDGTFDFVFGSDVAYRDHLHAPLVKSLSRFTHERSVALVGVTTTDTGPSFFDALWDAGFRYERLSDRLIEPRFRGTTFGIFAVERR